ncbi:MAG: hypothetical protein NVS9B10_05120 [Nevskia sp.]
MDTQQHTDHQRTRRRLLTSLAGGFSCLGLSGCGTSPTLDLLGSALTGIGDIGKAPSYGLSDAQIEALPYASLGLRIGGSQPAVVILASVDGDELHWASADRVVFVTRHGRLTKTVGLPRDLTATQWTGQDPLAKFPAMPVSRDDRRVYRFVDLRPNDDFSVPVQSSFDTLGDETLTILGHRHETVLVRERVVVRKWRWSADNLFWVDKTTGRIWKSRQQFCPEVPAMTLEILKPAAEPPVRA